MQLVYLSPVPWASFAQRPHKFVEWFREKTCDRVLWVDPYPTRLPVVADFRRKPDSTSTGSIAPDWLTVLRPISLPIEPLPCSGYLNGRLWRDTISSVKQFSSLGPTMLGIGKPSELALQLLSKIFFSGSFYDAMDDFPAFHRGLSRNSMAHRENKVIANVDSVIVSSCLLYDKWKGLKPVFLARNACAVQHLPQIETNKIGTCSDKIILGYVGTIGKWFDWDFVFKLALSKPQHCVKLIGPLYFAPPPNLPANITILPPCDHKDAIAAMQEFSIGLIPFKLTELTASVDPIKYYEYRALGLPVISSLFGEMNFHKNDPGVFMFSDAVDPGKIIDNALEHHDSFELITRFREINSWESRFNATELLTQQ
jgi:hypothetical protein